MKNNIVSQCYLVVVIDLLGQREILGTITGLPTNKNEKEEFDIKINKSVGSVRDLRNGFRKYFESAFSKTPNVNLVPSEQRDAFLASMKIPAISTYGFSDTTVIAVPLDENCAAINGIYYTFVATCGIGLAELSIRTPVRAGLEIGVASKVATKIKDYEIYGPALAEAYYLESKLAEYPRFLVGKELIKYLLLVENQKCNTRIGEVAKKTAKDCLQMVIQDTDGRYILDFLGEKIKEASENVIDTKLVASAFDFVIEQYRKYSKDDNDKLASRYYRLLQYFQSRKSIWGIN